MHIFPNSKKYIGITRQTPEKRWRNGKGYAHSNYINNAIKKYGWDNVKHVILYTNLTKHEAEQLEIELIKKYKSNNLAYGYNIANGGNYAGSVSEITKKKLSKIRKGSGNPMYGHTGAKCPRALKVNQYDLNGKYIKTWECAKDAALELKMSNSQIIACCKLKRKSAGGYQWRYFNGSIDDIQPYEVKRLVGELNPMYGKASPHRKKVYQFNKNGELIGEFDSLIKAESVTGVNFKDISSCCLGKYKSAGGYIWKYAS